jgi:hypothetical protein
MQAIATGEVIADYGEPTRWSDFDASVFLMTKVGEQLQGEYQLCNGYGTAKATPVLRVRLKTEHWDPPVIWTLPLTGGAHSRRLATRVSNSPRSVISAG